MNEEGHRGFDPNGGALNREHDSAGENQYRMQNRDHDEQSTATGDGCAWLDIFMWVSVMLGEGASLEYGHYQIIQSAKAAER